MDYKKAGNSFWLRVDRGEEIVSAIKKVAEKENIHCGAVWGIGAVNKVVAGLFDTSKKQYVSYTLEGDMEIVSLTGSITQMKGDHYLHLHIGLSDINGNMKGGHLNEAIVSGTCEIHIAHTEGFVDRQFDPDVGLNLMKFN
ncbi:MAG: DNA-binding protein [Clostridiales bacterium]|jgi:predicted DNA-binding protein with PD1-like motif|nr:DNA-binding protein [Clostridiales bacterium]HOB63975.1 DNA-binding protein [Clostridia bacterium]HOK82415.1 DNA-binding protein [Clostridia bacterium]HOL61542.1 DNA-binding protein [Clostridia bacterium]HPO54129.1 DNA-binding protein [Clostridia bacterium]